MAVKVGINGFGRIGRNVLRTALADKNLDFVAVNDLTDPKTLAHLLKYDSILGNLPNTITAGADSISIDGKVIKVFKEKDPAALPWDSVGAQVVLESTGRFTDANDARKHLRGSVKKSSSPRPPRTKTSPSSSASTMKNMTPPSTTLSRMRPAPRIVSLLLPKL